MPFRLAFWYTLVLFRFQGQTELIDSKRADLQSAIQEAFLAEQGFSDMLMVEIYAAAGNLENLETLSLIIGNKVIRCSNEGHNCNTQKQASVFLRKRL